MNRIADGGAEACWDLSSFERLGCSGQGDSSLDFKRRQNSLLPEQVMNLLQDHVVDPERLFTGVDLNSGMPVVLCCACVVESQKYSLISLQRIDDRRFPT